MNEVTDFVKRVIERLKGGDEQKIARFQRRTVKALETSIKTNQDEIESKQDSLTDLEETEQETILNVDVRRLGTDDLEEYMKEYLTKIKSAKSNKKKVLTEIEKLKQENVEFQELIDALK